MVRRRSPPPSRATYRAACPTALGAHPARVLALAALLALALAAPARAACRLALVLALDVSASVNPAEFKLQKEGLARALLAPEIRAILLSQPGAPVALTVFQWSNPPHQNQVLPWTLIDSAARLEAAARAIAAHPRGGLAGRTALGAAILHAGRLFAAAPECDRHALDISGDGRNNLGTEPSLAGAMLGNVTINALAVGGDLPYDHAGDRPQRQMLSVYYRAQVIRGPGAFVEIAHDYDAFEDAMRRKLVRELGEMALSSLAAPPGGSARGGRPWH